LLVLAYGAAVTSTGLALAMWIKQPGRAIAISVTAYVLVTVGWVILIFAVASRDNIGRGLAMASPFWGAGLVTVELEDHRVFATEILMWASLWTVVYLTMAGLLLTIIMRQFDHYMGRMNQHEHLGL
jgi:hypothetical protein